MFTLSLSLCSFNVRGIRELVKRKAVFLYCKSLKVDFYFLQETHALSSDYNLWKNQWGDNIWMSYGENNSAGVAILRGTFQGKILKSIVDDCGRWIILVVEHVHDILILGNVYGYNNSCNNRILFNAFQEEIQLLLNTFVKAKIILGGDWNCISDPTKDCHPPRKGVHGELNSLCTHLNCCDIWRNKNPKNIQFTWNSKDFSKRSRIDYWLISNDLIDTVEETNIQPSILTDHQIIYLKLNIDIKSVKCNANHWKLNSALLDDNLFKERALEVISLNWKKAQEEKTFGKHWEYTKYQIRFTAIQRGKELAKEKREKQDNIIKNIISIYENDEPTQTDLSKLNELQSELDLIYQYMAKGAFIRSRRKWLEHGEKNTKYFHGLEKRNVIVNGIYKLKIGNEISDDSRKISNSVEDFYKDLYSLPNKNSTIHNSNLFNFLSSIKDDIKQIDKYQKNSCDNELSLDDIYKGIRNLKENKAPGNDGLTAEFYKVFQEQLGQFLLCVFKEAINLGQLPPTLCQGLITLIPKPNKDNLLIDNWRPITLINNDAKILAQIFASRLKKCLESIIDECQSGFMQGRHISNNIRLILDLIDYNEFITDNSYILFVDIYKAFDTVSHDILFGVLELFGFGQYFIKAIKTLYNNCNSSVKLPWGTTHRFNILRGIKQGDPAAPFLFLLVMQTMAAHLQKNSFEGIQISSHEIKCCQLADDTAIFMKDKCQIKKIISCLNTFSEASGLSLNLKKCSLFPLKDSTDIELEGIQVTNEVTYLGIHITKNQANRTESNFQPLLPKIKSKFNMWLMRDLSLKGRILLSKTEGLSRVVYPAKVLDVSQIFLKNFDSALYNFIWRGKPHYLRKSVLSNSYEKGGLNALDFQTSNIIFKVNWLKHYINNKDKLWYLIPNLIFKNVGGIEFLLKCDFRVDKLPLRLSNFHKQALSCWLLMYKHNFSPHKQIIWNNKMIKYKRKSIFYDNWFNNNIVFVSQLLDNTGSLMNHTKFIETTCNSISPQEYAVVLNAIPTGYFRILQGNNIPIDELVFNSEIFLDGLQFNNKKCNNKYLRQVVSNSSTPRCKFYWNNIFTNINWDKIWVYNDRYIVQNKIVEVYYKIIHLIYPTNMFMKRYINKCDPCIFCNIEEENVLHLFYDCYVVRYFWCEVEHLFESLCGVGINLGKRDIFFYYFENNLDKKYVFLLNFLILYGKYYIHCCKWSKRKPNIVQFKGILKYYFKTIQNLSNEKAEYIISVYNNLNNHFE